MQADFSKSTDNKPQRFFSRFGKNDLKLEFLL